MTRTIICKNLVFISFLAIAFIACKKEDTSQNTVGVAPSPIVVDDWPVADERVVAQNLTHPWEIYWGKDDFIWMTERGGKLTKLNPKTGAIVFATSIAEVVSQGEGGLLGLVHDPNFLTNGWIYVVYNYVESSVYKEKIVRFTISNNAITNPINIMVNIPAANIHNGARLAFGLDGKMYISTGDAANTNLPQQTNSLAGKVLRINADGTIPADNPIAGSPVWSVGHRNPQGLVFANGKLYASEHGPNVEDEINIIERFSNYGWPNVTGSCDGAEISFCNANNVKAPLASSGNVTLAYSGLDFYTSTTIPQFGNCLLLATLKNQTLYAYKLNSTGTSVASVNGFLANKYGRLRDICVSPQGRVYICTSNGNNDKIIEIQKIL
jgi:aldose sugar dehydrogenase